MASFPQLNADDMPLVTKFLKVGYVGYKGKLNNTAEKTKSRYPNTEFVQIVRDRRDSNGKVYASDMQQIALYESGWRNASQSGAQGGGGQVNSGGTANALQKQSAGGGDGLGLGATDNKRAAAVIEGSFTGINLSAADTKLPIGKSPDAFNVEAGEIDGTVGPRPGLVMLYPRRYNSLTGTGGAIAATRKGRSLNFLSPTMWQSGQVTMVCTYDTTSIGGTGSSVTQTISKAAYPAWHPQHSVDSVKPLITLISNAAGIVQFTVAMPVRFRKNVANGSSQVQPSVDQLVVRSSAITYPRDRDGREAFSTVATGSTALKNYTAADGTSTTVAESGLTAGTARYYAAWYINKEGVSEPARFSVTVA